MSSNSEHKQEGSSPPQSLVLDHSPGPLPNPEPKTAGSAWQERVDLDRAAKAEEEFTNLVEQGFDKEFTDFRRASEFPQPPAAPLKSKAGDRRRSTADLTNDPRYSVKGIRGLCPAREVDPEDLGEIAYPPQYDSSSEDEEDPEPSAADKLGITVRSPTSPKTADQARSLSSAGSSRGSSAPSTSGCLASPTQRTVFQEVNGGAYKWYNEQDKSNVPDAKELRASTRDHVNFEEDQRFLEHAADITGLDIGVDPRPSFRDKIVPNKALAKPDETAAWLDLLAGIDPRETFRRGKDKFFGTRPPADGTDKNAIPQPKLVPQPATWVEKLVADYPGGFGMDLRVLIALVLFVLVVAITVTIYEIIDYQSLASTWADRTTRFAHQIAHLSEFRSLDTVFSPHKETSPAVSPIVLDPFGINKVLDWPITLSDLQTLNASFSLVTPSFSRLNQALKLVPATTALQYPAKPLSKSASERCESLESVQNSLSDLTLRYDIFITTLLEWSDRTPRDLQSLTEPSQKWTSSLGPWLGNGPAVQHLKEKLQLPVNELKADIEKLEKQTVLLGKSLRVAKTRISDFKFSLAEAEEWFVEKCISQNALGWVSISGHIACRDWNPSEISKTMQGVKVEEQVMLKEIEDAGRKLLQGIWSVANFYFDVIGELKARNSGKPGDQEFATLREVREFAESFVDRSGILAGGLREKMGK